METMTDPNPAIPGPRPDRPRGKSAQRRIRIPDHVYLPALKRATDDGHEFGRVVTALLDRYARGEIDA